MSRYFQHDEHEDFADPAKTEIKEDGVLITVNYSQILSFTLIQETNKESKLWEIHINLIIKN